ncbi:hypothetical protein TruAng_008827 [Truncatella angustata]|nr:hypothetical protein TruAng_008827 [Truncatella angustata]
MSADANPNVSNGTCFSTEHTENRGGFIPCDPGFNDRACPWKSQEFSNQEWVAIQQCQKGTGNNDTQWGGCKTSPDSTELEKLPHQSCDSFCTNTLYKGNTALPAFASLPSSTGSSIAWTNGFAPTLVYAPITSTADLSGMATTFASMQTRTPTISTTATQTISTSPTTLIATTSGDDSLSTGAKAGIGVGAAGAALMIIVIILLALLFRRRKKRAQNTQSNLALKPPKINPMDPYQPYQTYYSHQPTPKTRPDEQVDGTYAAGFKSELPANERPMTCELPADQSITFRSHLSPHPSPYPSTASTQSLWATFDSAGTDHVSSYSDSTTARGGNSNWITPENTGNHEYLGGSQRRA